MVIREKWSSLLCSTIMVIFRSRWEFVKHILKKLNLILLEVLMDCTGHFNLNSFLSSCVAWFTICWVCRLYFSGIDLLGAISRSECLIKINYRRFCVAPRQFCRFVWQRLRLICNLKCLLIEQRFFYERWLTFLFGGLVAVNFKVNILLCYLWC